jgi:hypothetical protein
MAPQRTTRGLAIRVKPTKEPKNGKQLEAARHEASMSVLKPLQGGVAKPKLPARSPKQKKPVFAPPLMSRIPKHTFEQLISEGNLYKRRDASGTTFTPSAVDTENASGLSEAFITHGKATLLSNSLPSPAQTESGNQAEVTPSASLNSSDNDAGEHYGMDELVKVENQLANSTADDIPTVIYLDVSVRNVKTSQPLMAPVLMKLQEQVSLVEFWRAIKLEHGMVMQEAKLPHSLPNSFTFQCTSVRKSADHSPTQKFGRRCLANDSRRSNRDFEQFLDFCLSEGKAKAEKLFDEARKKAKRVRVMRTKLPRYNAAGFEREFPKVEAPKEAPVFAEVQIFF